MSVLLGTRSRVTPQRQIWPLTVASTESPGTTLSTCGMYPATVSRNRISPRACRSWKVAPALACGCTIVMKPSEITPLTALVSIFSNHVPAMFLQAARHVTVLARKVWDRIGPCNDVIVCHDTTSVCVRFMSARAESACCVCSCCLPAAAHEPYTHFPPEHTDFPFGSSR